MDLISSSPNHVIREMTPKGNVIREWTEIWPVIRDLDPYSRPWLLTNWAELLKAWLALTIG